jgi:hypothetical protein
MSDIKFSQLAVLTAAADDDYMPIVDASDNAMGANGTNKRISFEKLSESIALDASQISTGIIDSARLPSYVDDVLEYVDFNALPGNNSNPNETPETGKIYVTLDTNKTYRWGGTDYFEISPSLVESVNGYVGIVDLEKGDVGLGNVDNTSDATKFTSTPLTGIPTAPTAAVDSNTSRQDGISQLATIEYTFAQIPVSVSNLGAAINISGIFNNTSLNPDITGVISYDGIQQNFPQWRRDSDGTTISWDSIESRWQILRPMDPGFVTWVSAVTTFAATPSPATATGWVPGLAVVAPEATGTPVLAAVSSGVNAGYLNTSPSLNSVSVGVQNRIKSTAPASVNFGVLNNTTGGTLNSSTGIISGTVTDITTQGKFATSLGLLNKTIGNYSTSIGYGNTSSSTSSLTLGRNNFTGASAQSVVAIGVNNTTSANSSFSTVIGYVNETFDSGQSCAIGNSNYSGTQGTAVGTTNNARGQGSTAVGFNNNTSSWAGNFSSAFGNYNDALGLYATAVGASNEAVAINSVCLGRSNYSRSTAHASIGVGILNNTSGTRVIDPNTGAIIGSVNVSASHGRLSTAVGVLNNTSGEASTAIGYDNIASGANSGAFGTTNTASGSGAAAFGRANTSSGSGAAAFGRANTSSGANSSAFGTANTASGANSGAFGLNVITSVDNTQEFGIGNPGLQTRSSAVRVHGTGYVSLSLQNSATALTDGGAIRGSEADGTLMRNAYALRRNNSDVFIDINDSAGVVTTVPILSKVVAEEGEPEWTVSGGPVTPVTSFDASTATLDDIYDVLATLIQTLKDRQVI